MAPQNDSKDKSCIIPRIDFERLIHGDAASREDLREGIYNAGFIKIYNTPIDASKVSKVFETFLRFFRMPDQKKEAFDMAKTKSNRGWGRSGSERVNPAKNPDYKQFFDIGFELDFTDPLYDATVYGKNIWPEALPGFKTTILDYYNSAIAISKQLLGEISLAMSKDSGYFRDSFTKPMALLRANYYPARPSHASDLDFGIAEHTDYGCLTLLATDEVGGLEVQSISGEWIPLNAGPGEFIINFGEMLEIWSGGKVRATPHRVVGSTSERVSLPLFFNPNADTIISPEGKPPRQAGDHLAGRFKSTYLHLAKD